MDISLITLIFVTSTLHLTIIKKNNIKSEVFNEPPLLQIS